MRYVGAKIGDRLHVKSQDASLGVKRKARVALQVAAVGVVHQAFAALGRPLHRPLQLARRPQHQHMLGIEEDLHPEAAAHVRSHDAKLFARDVEDPLGNQVAQIVRALAAGIQRHAPGRGIEVTDGRARFHRIGADAVVDQVDFGDVGSLGHGCLDRVMVAMAPVEGAVAVQPGMHAWGVRLQCRIGFDDGLELVVILHLDQLGRVLGCLRTFGNHHRHGLADMMDRLGCKRGPFRAPALACRRHS